MDPKAIEAHENVAYERPLSNGQVAGYNVYGRELYRCNASEAGHMRTMYSQSYKEAE